MPLISEDSDTIPCRALPLRKAQALIQTTVKTLIFLLPFFSGYIFYKVYLVRQEAFKMGVSLNNISDLYYVILCTSVLLIGRAGVNRLVRDYLHLKIEQLYDFPFWEIKKRKIVYDSVSLCWYFIIVLYGIYIAWDSP